MSDRIAEFYAKVAKGKFCNLNVPAMARRDEFFMQCWLADEGKTFVSQDVVSLEPSVTAHFSQDKRYRWATVDGIGKAPYYDGDVLMIDDVYLMTASVLPPTAHKIRKAWDDGIFNTWLGDSEAVKKALKGPRSFAKVCALGLGYGMGAKKLQKTCEEAGVILTFHEAKAVRARYWDLFYGLRDFADRLQFRVEKDGFLINPFWYRITPEPHKAFNAYIQSSASGVLDLYCMELFEVAQDMEFVALIHDEIIFQCPDERLKDLPSLTEECTRSVNKTLNWSVPIRFGTVTCKTFEKFK
jgi:DNA polymerase I-like protein with 3'-5' exonuclease and polymerase domains